MTDSTRVNELQDKLLQSIEILNNASLKSISYDKTILCTIENDQNKKEGKYEVSDGSMIFVAYSTNTNYSKGNQVYVTIPNGNFENQKMIIGKKTNENSEPFVFTTPFDTIFDLTGNLTPGAKKTTILANGNNQDNQILANENSTYWNKINQAWEPAAPAYTRLGVRADFQTWCSEAIVGDYGLEITIIGEKNDITNGTTTGQIKEATYTLYLSALEMYGNPYNFESNYSQEKVYDISEIGKIKSIKAKLYQRSNFYNADGNLLKIQEDDFTVFDNIFVDNLYICGGYDLGTFDKEYVEIFTNDVLTFSKELSNNQGTEISDGISNKKQINLRWVHLENDQRYDMSKYKNDNPEISYEIRWYRYVIGSAAADEYCGVYWSKITENLLNCGEIINGSMYFYPDVNNQIEKIKAIVFVNGIPYHSNIIEFNNQELVPNQVQKYYENALEIVTDDGTNGNYLVYGQSGKLLDYDVDTDNSTAKDLITLSLKFNGTGKLDNQDNWDIIPPEDYLAKYVTWTIPENNSMMQFIGNNELGCPQFKLKTHYSPSYGNNTVIATYTKNNITYTTEKEFTFGHAGTMGADQTIVIDFEGDQKFYDITEESKTVYFIVRIYDVAGRDISGNINSDSNIIWSWKNPPMNAGAITSINGTNNQKIVITTSGWTMNDLPILQVKVGDLETYFPIPLQNGSNYTHITGATQVVYRTDSVPEYDKSEYKLYANNIEQYCFWKIIGGDNYSATIGTTSNPHNGRLRPVGMYVDGAAVYGIQAYIDEKNPYWTQPILIIQNKYPSNIINTWDGKTLTINEEEGYILTNSIAAGKKNSDDNTFSGVMMGQIGQASTAIAGQTGVYGFYHGDMAYAFKDDGTAFIGRSGLGRIEFNGDDGTIQSSSYQISNKTNGMIINLGKGSDSLSNDINNGYNTPYIIMKGEPSATSNPAPIISVKNSFPPNNEKIYPLQIGNKFKVSWDGTLYAQGAGFKGNIYSSAGEIGGWTIDTNILSGTNIELNSTGKIIIGSTIGKQIILDSTNSERPSEIIIGNGIRIDGANSQLIMISKSIAGTGPIYFYGGGDVTKPTNMMGTFGLVEGTNGDSGKTTYNLGIHTFYGNYSGEEYGSIILDAGRNIRLTARGSEQNLSTAKNGTVYLEGKALVCDFSNSDPTKQKGIYARFA